MATDSHAPDTTPSATVDAAAPATAPAEPVRIARIERYDDAPDECTISPADATAETVTTTWITARGDSFVRLDAMR
jgi:nucleoid-associated protein YgaU